VGDKSKKSSSSLRPERGGEGGMRFGGDFLLEPTVNEKDGDEPCEVLEPTSTGIVMTRACKTLTSWTNLVARKHDSDVGVPHRH